MSVDGSQLVARARGAVERTFVGGTAPPAEEAWWSEPAATFVTLTRGGELRGCIGSVSPRRPLLEDVEHNARAAAFQDPRFAPLRPEELDAVRFEVSLLGPLEPLEFTDEADALRQLRPHVDGVVLTWQDHRGLFLPQVWDQLPEPARFLAALKRKAGLSPGFWAADVRLERFEVHKWKEPRE